MKIKITRKEIKEGFRKVYCCGYCDLKPLFTSSDATFYNAGVYGWNYDGVMIDNDTIILTGYRGFFGESLPGKCYNIIRKANKIQNNYNIDWKEKAKKIKYYKKQFIKALAAC